MYMYTHSYVCKNVHIYIYMYVATYVTLAQNTYVATVYMYIQLHNIVISNCNYKLSTVTAPKLHTICLHVC